MAKQKPKQKESEEHTHTWKYFPELGEYRCQTMILQRVLIDEEIRQVKKLCSMVKMSSFEYHKHKEIWDKYYKDVETTTAFKIFHLQHEATKRKKWHIIKELALEAKKYQPTLSKPPISDPLILNANQNLVILESDENAEYMESLLKQP